MPVNSTNYTPDQILKYMSDPVDSKRKKAMDAAFAKAQAGDPNAIRYLQTLSGDVHDLPPDVVAALDKQYGRGKWGAATQDGQNYARYLNSQLTGTPWAYRAHGDAYIGDDLGKVLKIGGMAAGALIPGVGTLGAGAIGAGSSVAGDLVQGKKPNLLGALGAGGVSAAGNALLGNGLGSTAPAAAGGVPAGVGNATQSGPGIGAQMAGALPSVAGSGGLLGHGGVLGTGLSTNDALNLGLGAAGAVQNANQQSHANALQDQAMQYATQDWANRAPLRQQAIQRMLAPLPQAQDQSALFAANQVNPFARRG